MLARKNRLKKEKDFSRVLRAGKKIKDDCLLLKFISIGDSALQTRFGVSVSKKVSKKATLRNKIRRRLLSLCALYLPKLKRKADIVIFVMPGFDKKTFPEIKKNIEDIFLKAGLL